MHPVLTPLLLSLKVAVCAVAISLVLGVLCGFLLARCRFPGRELLDTLLTLPMVMPPTVLGFYLLVLFGRRSALGGWLNSIGIELVFTVCRLPPFSGALPCRSPGAAFLRERYLPSPALSANSARR